MEKNAHRKDKHIKLSEAIKKIRESVKEGKEVQFKEIHIGNLREIKRQGKESS